MTEAYDPSEISGSPADCSEQTVGAAQGDHTRPQVQEVRGQLVEHLADLQEEYRQLRSSLVKVQSQIARHEAHVRQCLEDALTLADAMQHVPERNSPATSAGGAVLYVQTLGTFSVEHHAQTVSLGSNRNGRALFRYLVTLPERRAARDVLLENFWPDDDPQTAAHKLHIAVSALRHALGEFVDGETILFVDDHYLLSPSLQFQLDIQAFVTHAQAGERLEREGDLTRAIAEYEAARQLYRGDFLGEDLYADWAIARRARYEEIVLSLLGRLAKHYADRGSYADSISCCRQILARDSFREDAYRQLMCCYSRMGQRNQALLEYKLCRTVLRRELGVEPMSETSELYDRIANGEDV